MKLLGEFLLPYSLELPRKTKKNRVINLSMNIYRNMNYFLSNEIKKIFKPIRMVMYHEMKCKIMIEYIVYRSTKRKYDLMNVVCIVDKFFLDWLVVNKYICDDDSCVISEYKITISDEKSEKNMIEARLYGG